MNPNKWETIHPNACRVLQEDSEAIGKHCGVTKDVNTGF